MARKLFSRIIVLTSLLVLFGCTSTQQSGPSLGEVEKFLPKEMGYLTINTTADHRPDNPHAMVILAQTEVGGKYLTMKKGKYPTCVDLELTQFAIDNGAFKEGKKLFVPIGTKQLKLVDQKTTEYPGGEYKCENEIEVKIDLNEFGQQVMAVFNQPIHQHWLTKLERVSGGHQRVVLYKGKKSPGWEELTDHYKL